MTEFTAVDCQGFAGGFTLGTAWSSAGAAEQTWHAKDSVQALARRIPLRGIRVLDLGCLEGVHSIGLALAGARVTAVDARIENVAKTLVRAWVSGVTANVDVHLVDVEREDLVDRLGDAGITGPFDLIFHRELLHHLTEPQSHLRRLAPLSFSGVPLPIPL